MMNKPEFPKPRIIRESFLPEPMTEFQPRKQNPEEVANGLRNAFRQAIKDGVMDATPYLNQMTFKSDIEKTEAEIKVLQKKLELLKEIETHKSQPRMNLVKKGKFESVSYNDEFYVRMDYSHNILWYKSKNTKNLDGNNLTLITDGETRRLLEGVWFNDVKHGKYDDVSEEWLPDELEYEEDEMGYNQGWNDCLNEIKTKLR